jgi:hypothetical protein
VRLLDWLAAALLLGSGAAFVSGAGALSRAEDLQAIYWLGVGIASLRAAVQLVRPGAGA